MTRANTIADLKKLLTELEEERDALNQQITSVRNTVSLLEARSEPTYGSSQQAQVLRDSIYSILSEHHPLHRRTIWDKLIERGITVGGKDPVNTVGAHLSKDDRFRNVGKGEWELDERYAEQVTNDNQHALPAVTEESESVWPSEVLEVSERNAGGYGGYGYEAPRRDEADDLPW